MRSHRRAPAVLAILAALSAFAVGGSDLQSQLAFAENGGGSASLFVDAKWLKANLSQVTLVDARSEEDYKKGHIPGAVSAPWQQFTLMQGKPGDAGWGVLLPKSKLSALLGARGIKSSRPVVVYAQTPGWGEDGRFTWMARMAGIDQVKILDGGVDAWRAAGGKESKETPAPSKAVLAIDSLDERLTATTEWIRSRQAKIKIVDARTKEEFDGATKYGEARGGHLPGAILIPFTDLFKADGTVKSVVELRALFSKAGLKPGDEIVAYCTGGIRSAHMTLMLRLAGFSKARNYDASYWEWAGNKELPLGK